MTPVTSTKVNLTKVAITKVAMINRRPLSTGTVRGTILFLAAALLAGCQSQPVAPPSDQEITHFAHQVRTQAIADLTVIQACSALGGNIGDLASSTRESWTFTNQAIMDAADNRLGHSGNDWVSIDEQPYSLSALHFLRTQSEQSASQLNLVQRGPDSQKSTCRTALAKIESRQLTAFAASPAIAAALESGYGSDISEALTTEYQMAKFAARPAPGRSYFAVSESTAKSCGGGELTLMTLVNNWPDETYGVFCAGQPTALVRCQWGECQQQQPGPHPD